MQVDILLQVKYVVAQRCRETIISRRRDFGENEKVVVRIEANLASARAALATSRATMSVAEEHLITAENDAIVRQVDVDEACKGLIVIEREYKTIENEIIQKEEKLNRIQTDKSNIYHAMQSLLFVCVCVCVCVYVLWY